MGLVIVREFPQAFECSSGEVVLLLHHRNRSACHCALTLVNHGEEDPLFFDHVLIQFGLESGINLDQFGQRARILVSVNRKNLSSHRFQPWEFFLQGLVIGNQDVVDQVLEGCLNPALFRGGCVAEFCADLLEDRLKIHALGYAGLLECFAAITAEINSMAMKDSCRQGMLGGQLANGAVTLNNHFYLLLSGVWIAFWVV